MDQATVYEVDETTMPNRIGPAMPAMRPPV